LCVHRYTGTHPHPTGGRDRLRVESDHGALEGSLAQHRLLFRRLLLPKPHQRLRVFDFSLDSLAEPFRLRHFPTRNFWLLADAGPPRIVLVLLLLGRISFFHRRIAGGLAARQHGWCGGSRRAASRVVLLPPRRRAVRSNFSPLSRAQRVCVHASLFPKLLASRSITNRNSRQQEFKSTAARLEKEQSKGEHTQCNEGHAPSRRAHPPPAPPLVPRLHQSPSPVHPKILQGSKVGRCCVQTKQW
jgi:hypothetical protein